VRVLASGSCPSGPPLGKSAEPSARVRPSYPLTGFGSVFKAAAKRCIEPSWSTGALPSAAYAEVKGQVAWTEVGERSAKAPRKNPVRAVKPTNVSFLAYVLVRLPVGMTSEDSGCFEIRENWSSEFLQSTKKTLYKPFLEFSGISQPAKYSLGENRVNIDRHPMCGD
jgi:hypothetical protein